MSEEHFNLIYKKAKKIRTNLLVYTEKNIKLKQKKENKNKINNILNQNIFQEGSMEVSFEEFFCGKNVQIFTENLDKNEKKVIPNLSKISFYHSSEKSLCSFKEITTVSTDTSFTKNNIANEKQKNKDYYFLNKKSKTKTELLFLFENDKYPIDYENVKKNTNRNIQTFNGNLMYDYKRNNTIGKKYLRNLSKFLGVISHKKKKITKKSFIKRSNYKKKCKKED